MCGCSPTTGWIRREPDRQKRKRRYSCLRVPPLCNVPNMYRENVAFLIGGSDLYHGGRTIGGRERAAVGFSDAGVAGENVGAAVHRTVYAPPVRKCINWKHQGRGQRGTGEPLNKSAAAEPEFPASSSCRFNQSFPKTTQSKLHSSKAIFSSLRQIASAKISHIRADTIKL